MQIPLMNLPAQYQELKEDIDSAVAEVFTTGQYILGPQVAGLEREIAAYLGTDQAVGVASGTDALVLALRALSIGSGDEVICPTYTFFATVEAVAAVGAKPVLVDSRPDTLCLDVDQVAAKINDRTKAIIAVHLYGHPADMNRLTDLARAKGVKLIEDNAQAMGAAIDGRKTGSWGDVGCLSFFPSKNLGGCGDGGMVVTNDAELAQKVKMFRTHGWRSKYQPELMGYNSRLDALQAAVLRVKLNKLDQWNAKRRELAGRYTAKLAGAKVTAPFEGPGCEHVYHLYLIRTPDRDKLQATLKAAGIASAVYYPYPIHLTPACGYMGLGEGSFPVAEQAAQENLAIPLFPELTEEQMDYVVSVVRSTVGEAS